MLAGCKVRTRWQIRIWRQTGGFAGFVPRFQSLHKRYVNLLNCEMLSASPLHVQGDSREDCADQPKECWASTRLAQSWGHTYGLTSALLLVLSTVYPQGISVCLHIQSLLNFLGLWEHKRWLNSLTLWLPVFGCISEGPPMGTHRPWGSLQFIFESLYHTALKLVFYFYAR